MNRRHLLLLAALPPALALAACGKRPSTAAALKPDAHVLALGDSLTAGYGATLEQDQGVNGDTSAGALQRSQALLAANSYDAVLIGIGGNDMLRGMSRQSTMDNVAAIVRAALAHTPYVAVIATPAPEPLRATVGSLSDAGFYEEVATREKALLVADVYSTVLSDGALRSDRIHANAQGYAVIAQKLADKLKVAGWR